MAAELPDRLGRRLAPQEAAVTAIEERDGFRFYIDKTPPLAPIRLVRTPA